MLSGTKYARTDEQSYTMFIVIGDTVLRNWNMCHKSNNYFLRGQRLIPLINTCQPVLYLLN